PGGESWADLALRLRSFYRDLEAAAPDGRVLIVAHDAIVVMTRYLVEELTEKEVMEVEKEMVPNASVTRWRRDGQGLKAVCYNATAHLVGAGVAPSWPPGIRNVPAAVTARRRGGGRGATRRRRAGGLPPGGPRAGAPAPPGRRGPARSARTSTARRRRPGRAPAPAPAPPARRARRGRRAR